MSTKAEKLRESTEQYVHNALAAARQKPPPEVVQATVSKVMAAFSGVMP